MPFQSRQISPRRTTEMPSCPSTVAFRSVIFAPALPTFSALPALPACLPLRCRVRRVLLVHQPLIHPADDVLEAPDAMAGFAGARQFVRLAREADHHRRDLPVF